MLCSLLRLSCRKNILNILVYFGFIIFYRTAVLNEKVCDGKETAARFGVLYVIKLCE